jgi:hypothetical protein
MTRRSVHPSAVNIRHDEATKSSNGHCSYLPSPRYAIPSRMPTTIARPNRGKRHNQALIALARRRCDVLFALLGDGTFYCPPTGSTLLTIRPTTVLVSFP